ncbi:hypothetical protein L914_21708 [Phytophthora nicotianae]|uniref:Ubiquitin-like protease family profile domain-containing protein n=1 Tax=Phytophthora nicotianae TaxID=4792 RepID=W2M4U1_PHYNI|nr:hypothetical protein L914_21708 [Phytophthora nicotianae]
MVKHVPDFAPRTYRVQRVESDLGVQVDSYNCDVYVLLAFEAYAGAQDLTLINRKELQYLCYRY